MLLLQYVLFASALLFVLVCHHEAAATNSVGAYGLNFFADSQSTYYEGYQQAWRYLGWYVKCGYPSDRYDEEQKGSHDKSKDNEEERWQGNNYCQRYLIWAAYIDKNYQGGGIGEYSYYDPYAKSWDSSACAAHGNGRCAPMDCHMNNTTTWKLMGVFKEAGYFGKDAFFEQLFKHEGVCLYNAMMDNGNDFYEFMSDARESAWTEGCVNTGVQITNAYYKYSDYYASLNTNGYLYIDLKPTWNGNMTYGLYTDSTCKYEYELPDADVDAIAKQMGLLYGDSLKSWNDGLEAFKVCQPCRAYNIKNDYATDEYSEHYADDIDPNEGYFQCNDDAKYTNVNQCMKFRTHADLEVATWEDLVTATNQGGILEVNVSGTIFGSERMSAADYKYLIKMRQDELSSEAWKAVQYRIDAARVENMKPEVKTWSLLGGSSLATGLLCLLGVACLLRRKHFGRPQEKKLKQPLLAKRDFFLSGPSGSMLTADLDYNLSMILPHNATAQTLPNVDEEDDSPPTKPEKCNKAKEEFVDDCSSSMSSLSYLSNLQDDKDVPTNETTYNVFDDLERATAEDQSPKKKAQSNGLADVDALNDIVGPSHQDEHDDDIELMRSYVDSIAKKDAKRRAKETLHHRQESLLDTSRSSDVDDSSPGVQDYDLNPGCLMGKGPSERQDDDTEDGIIAAIMDARQTDS